MYNIYAPGQRPPFWQSRLRSQIGIYICICIYICISVYIYRVKGSHPISTHIPVYIYEHILCSRLRSRLGIYICSIYISVSISIYIGLRGHTRYLHIYLYTYINLYYVISYNMYSHLGGGHLSRNCVGDFDSALDARFALLNLAHHLQTR